MVIENCSCKQKYNPYQKLYEEDNYKKPHHVQKKVYHSVKLNFHASNHDDFSTKNDFVQYNRITEEQVGYVCVILTEDIIFTYNPSHT